MASVSAPASRPAARSGRRRPSVPCRCRSSMAQLPSSAVRIVPVLQPKCLQVVAGWLRRAGGPYPQSSSTVRRAGSGRSVDVDVEGSCLVLQPSRRPARIVIRPPSGTRLTGRRRSACDVPAERTRWSSDQSASFGHVARACSIVSLVQPSRLVSSVPDLRRCRQAVIPARWNCAPSQFAHGAGPVRASSPLRAGVRAASPRSFASGGRWLNRSTVQQFERGGRWVPATLVVPGARRAVQSSSVSRPIDSRPRARPSASGDVARLSTLDVADRP